MSEREAQELMVQADKKATSRGWFGGDKYDEAVELYIRAANSFKLAKRWHEAGEAFYKAADIHIKMNERDEAAADYVNASKSLKKINPQQSINALQEAINILTERGRFYMAAGYQKSIAETYETDLKDNKASMEAYDLAAEWFSAEESASQANTCTLKAAHFAAELELYSGAIQKFESVAEGSVNNQLTKWSVKEYFLKAGLCWLCTQDNVGAQRAIDRYREMDASFQNTRECQFLVSLLEAVENGDVDSFTNHVYEFDKLSVLDNWKTTILLRIKRSITEEASLM